MPTCLRRLQVSLPTSGLDPVLTFASQNEVTKSGFLSKTGKRNPKYARYWFRLKGNVLSYYDSSTNRYFPHGQIDLTYGISAAITDKDKEGIHFEVVTPNRTYHFRAESAPSAKEWVRSLQRVIFRSHNDGDNVKISIPISNIMDVEEAQMVDFAHTCKIRVIDSDETYAIDEVRMRTLKAQWICANNISISLPSSAWAWSQSTCSTFSSRRRAQMRPGMRMGMALALRRVPGTAAPMRSYQRKRQVRRPLANH